MDDRELLERAAKVAGVFMTRDEWPYSDEPTEDDFALEFDEERGALVGPVLVYNYEGELSGTTRQKWNPLNDDGDALRLAVKLGLALYPPECADDGATVSTPGPDGIWHVEDRTDDPCSDMRRAIVRAAAAMAQEGEAK